MDTHLAKQIGSAARAARTRLGVSQADAAERIGISTEFYARIERGNTLPSTPTLVAIANGLGVGADVLLGRNALRTGPAIRDRTHSKEEPPEVRRLLRRLRRADRKTIRVLNVVAAALVERRR